MLELVLEIHHGDRIEEISLDPLGAVRGLGELILVAWALLRLCGW